MKSWADFLAKLSALREKRESNLALFLNPRLENLPLSIARFDDPFLPYGKEIIRATQDLVVAYVFDLASYFALGAAGIVALERTIRFAGDSVTILHAPFASGDYSAMADITGLGVDAITVTDVAILRTYLDKPPYAAFADAVSVADEGFISGDKIPEMGGLFSLGGHILYRDSRGQSFLRLTNDSFLSASKGEDYLDVIRKKLEAEK
jgi:hypothetical protein